MTSQTQDPARNEATLADWLAKNISEFKGPFTLTRLSGGQSNPTWRINSSNGSYILRSKPTGQILASAHAVDREYRVLHALSGTKVPVPETIAYCDDPNVFGSEFYIMRFVDGRILWDPTLPGFAAVDRARVFDSMNAAIAAIHSVDIAAAGLSDYGRHGGYIERQISRWTRQYRKSETTRIPAMENLIAWLPDHAPKDDLTRLVHGDYRLDNVILHPEKPEIVGVLDWELSTLGSPIADFAYHAMTWRFAPELFRGLAGTDFTALGIPDEKTYVDSYFRRTGFERPKSWEFYMVLSMFRIAAILQGIKKRAIDGTASDARAAELGTKVLPIADLAWDIAKDTR